MKKSILILILILYIFIGCAPKEVKNKLIALPFYNKDKANIYITNSSDERNIFKLADNGVNHINFIYKITGEQYTLNGVNCYSQYSYFELDEGSYKIEFSTPQFQLLGKREDHNTYENAFKKGIVYLFKIQGIRDDKATVKSIFSLSGTIGPADVKLGLIEINTQEALIHLSRGLEFTHPIKNERDYPLRAEDNPKDETCSRWF